MQSAGSGHKNGWAFVHIEGTHGDLSDLDRTRSKEICPPRKVGPRTTTLAGLIQS